MTANLDNIVAYFERNCADLMKWARSAPAGTTAYAVEAEILKRVLEIGIAAMSTFLMSESVRDH